MSVVAYISKSALKHNLKIVKEYSNSKIVAIVKANAYGHNIKFVVQALQEIDFFAVANIEEALELQQLSAKKILILSDFYHKDSLDLISKNNFHIVVYNTEQINWLLNSNKKINIWLKIDTSMNRLGLTFTQFNHHINRLINKNNINIVAIMSHLHSANIDINSSLRQLKLFNTYSKKYNNFAKSIANSAAIMAIKQTHLDYIRPGIMLYGISPFGIKHPKLAPVMRLTAKVIALKKLTKGDKVGYGQTYSVDDDTNIAVVNIGYANGYPYNAKNNTPVLINNNICYLIGKVSMNLICVDIKNHKVAINDTAILWGDALAVEEIAIYSNTIAYELVTKIKAKYKITT